MIEISKEEH